MSETRNISTLEELDAETLRAAVVAANKANLAVSDWLARAVRIQAAEEERTRNPIRTRKVDGPWPGWRLLVEEPSGRVNAYGPDGEEISENFEDPNLKILYPMRKRRPFWARPGREEEILANSAGKIRTFGSLEAAKKAIDAWRGWRVRTR